MSEKSNIQWTDATWNPWHGCKKVSAGCKNCYMYRDKEHYGQDPAKVLRSKGKFNDPLKWMTPRRVFTCSWSDWFIEEADLWRDEAWAIIKATPHLTYQILTKRPERIHDHLPADWGNGYLNVWLGVSVENQEAANKRIPLLLSTPAAVRFLSCEPLLEAVQLTHIDAEKAGHPDYIFINSLTGRHTDMGRPWYDVPKIDWVIVGGESGNHNGKYGFRPTELNWYLSLIQQCKDAKVSCFIKQLGTYYAYLMNYKDRHGGDITEWPAALQIREFPEQKTNLNAN